MSDEKAKRAEVVPFGKYKGQPVEVLRADQGYVDWLMGQDWVKQRYPNLVQIVVNNFTAPSETPDHNRIQSLFLDSSFRYAFIDLAAGLKRARSDLRHYAESAVDSASRRFDEALRSARNSRAWANGDPNSWYTKQAAGYEASAEVFRAEIRAAQSVLASNLESARIEEICESSVEFEVGGWDVRIDVQIAFRSDSWRVLHVEIKPSLGDDYPAVLRQMKSNGKKGWLVIESFSAVGATQVQVAEIFKLSGFKLVTLDEIYENQRRLDEPAVEWEPMP